MTFKSGVAFDKTAHRLNGLLKRDYKKLLDKYGALGVDALKAATPIDTGLTFDSWRYQIEEDNTKIELKWLNDNVQNGVPIAIILHYGHATATGGYVQGYDYITSAIQPVIDKLLIDIRKEVQR